MPRACHRPRAAPGNTPVATATTETRGLGTEADRQSGDATYTNLAADLSGAPLLPAPALEARLAEARANLAAATALGDAGLTHAPAGVSSPEISVRRTLLQRLVRLSEQQLSNIAALETTKTRKAEIVRESQAWTRFEEPLPCSMLLTDRLQEEIQTEGLNVSNGGAANATLAQIVEDNRQSLAQAEGRIHQLNEQLESTPDPALAARLSWQRELERLRSQGAAGTLAVLELERLIGQEVVSGSRLRLGLLQRQLLIADAGAKFTQADLDIVNAQNDRRRKQFERELTDAQARARRPWGRWSRRGRNCASCKPARTQPRRQWPGGSKWFRRAWRNWKPPPLRSACCA